MANNVNTMITPRASYEDHLINSFAIQENIINQVREREDLPPIGNFTYAVNPEKVHESLMMTSPPYVEYDVLRPKQPSTFHTAAEVIQHLSYAAILAATMNNGIFPFTIEQAIANVKNRFPQMNYDDVFLLCAAVFRSVKDGKDELNSSSLNSKKFNDSMSNDDKQKMRKFFSPENPYWQNIDKSDAALKTLMDKPDYAVHDFEAWSTAANQYGIIAMRDKTEVIIPPQPPT